MHRHGPRQDPAAGHLKVGGETHAIGAARCAACWSCRPAALQALSHRACSDGSHDRHSRPTRTRHIHHAITKTHQLEKTRCIGLRPPVHAVWCNQQSADVAACSARLQPTACSAAARSIAVGGRQLKMETNVGSRTPRESVMNDSVARHTARLSTCPASEQGQVAAQPGGSRGCCSHEAARQLARQEACSAGLSRTLTLNDAQSDVQAQAHGHRQPQG